MGEIIVANLNPILPNLEAVSMAASSPYLATISDIKLFTIFLLTKMSINGCPLGKQLLKIAFPIVVCLPLNKTGIYGSLASSKSFSFT